MTNEHYNLLLSYTWEYDKEFAERVKYIFDKEGLSVFIFNEKNVHEVTEKIIQGGITFDVYLDRASDVDEDFERVFHYLETTDTFIINPQPIAEEVCDKAYMYPLIIENNIPTPETMLLPPYDEVPELALNEETLEKIGIPLVVKPCYYNGGGEGVAKNVMTKEEIDEARKFNKDDYYLVQNMIQPKIIDSRRAWLRIIYAFGRIITMWWDDETHIYSHVSEEDYQACELQRIEPIMRKLAELSKLDYFSTEIALTEGNELYVIDYVNDQCDMRLKSNHPDGVPEDIVDEFIYSMINSLIRT